LFCNKAGEPPEWRVRNALILEPAQEGIVMPLSHVDLDKIVKDRAFAKLVGELENEVLDCKREPYQLTDSGKLDLASDVLAFANAEGGSIILGMRTEPTTTSRFDRVVELRPFAEALVDTKQYVQIIESWIYPTVSGVTVRWLQPDGITDDKGVVVIDIPRQPHAPSYLLTRTFDPSGKQTGNLFSHLQRIGDRNRPLSVQDMHRYFQLGLHYEKLEGRFDGIEGLLTEAFQQRADAQHQALSEIRTEQRIQHALDMGFRGAPSLVLAAVPEPAAPLRTFMKRGPGTVRDLLGAPPNARANGWNMATLSGAKFDQGEALLTTDPKAKVLSAYRDGSLIYAGAAGSYYLGVGAAPNSMNAIALAETVTTFCLTYRLILVDAGTTPKRIRFLAQFHDMGLEPLINLNYRPPSLLKLAPAPNHTMRQSIVIDFKDYNPSRLAFLILADIFAWFNVAPEWIPGVIRNSDEPEIDPSWFERS
jgi:hypothetical protein